MREAERLAQPREREEAWTARRRQERRHRGAGKGASDLLGMKVALSSGESGRGEISIAYRDLEQLDADLPQAAAA